MSLYAAMGVILVSKLRKISVEGREGVKYHVFLSELIM